MDSTLQQLSRARIKRLGILGGTFDPVHNAHISLAKAAMEEFELDSVLLLVSGEPPHKNSVAHKEHRYAMAALVAEKIPGIRATRMEIDRGGMTYTIDSLRQIRAALGDSVELFYIMGEDTLAEIPSWRDYEAVLGLTRLAVYFREGMDDELVMANARNQLKKYSGRIHFGREKLGELSSTAVRKRSAQGLSLAGLVPDAVEAYIVEHALYAQCAMTFEQAGAKVSSVLSQKRLRHTLGVVQTAQELAERFGADVAAAKWAALLHDCAKKIDDDEAMAMCLAWGVEMDDILTGSPKLIHGPLGAEIARREYGMDDEEVLDAIRFHSTGKPNMSLLCKILYLADMIEPGRVFAQAKALRMLAQVDLDEALRLSMDVSIGHILHQGELLHPLTVYARNFLLSKK